MAAFCSTCIDFIYPLLHIEIWMGRECLSIRRCLPLLDVTLYIYSLITFCFSSCICSGESVALDVDRVGHIEQASVHSFILKIGSNMNFLVFYLDQFNRSLYARVCQCASGSVSNPSDMESALDRN